MVTGGVGVTPLKRQGYARPLGTLICQINYFCYGSINDDLNKG